jgi:hypothetical protein
MTSGKLRLKCSPINPPRTTSPGLKLGDVPRRRIARFRALTSDALTGSPGL